MASSDAHNFGLDSTTAEEIASAFSSQIRGKTVLTTGVSPDGLGAYFVQTIAKHQPKLLILATRDISKANATAQAIAASAPGVQTRVLHLDLASQAQVRKAAAEVNAYEEPIDVLVNNAAVFSSERGKMTEDGLELLFGTNHIGHFLFTNLIIGRILAAGSEARIVNVASGGYRFSPIRFDDVDFSVRFFPIITEVISECLMEYMLHQFTQKEKDYNIWKAYGQSKTASMLFSISLAEKLASKGVLSFSVHPGVIATNLGRAAAGKESLTSLSEFDLILHFIQD